MIASVTIIATLKKIFKKSWAFIKKQWKFFSGIGVAILIMVVARNSSGLKSVISRVREDYEKDIDVIEKAHKKEIEDRDTAIERYKSSMDQIEKNYKDRKETLDKKKAKEIEKIILENAEDPDEITRRISEITGFEIHLD